MRPISSKVEIHTARSGAEFNKYDNGFYATGRLCSHTIHLLIDSGATSSLISAKKLKEIDPHQLYKIKPITHTLHAVNGQQMSLTGSVDLSLELGSKQFNLTFIVCDIESDSILGQDFLRHHVDVINYKQSCLIIGTTNVPLWTGGQAVQVCRVEIRETVKIPAQSRKWVSVQIPHAEHLADDGLVEPCLDLMSRKEITLVGGLVDTTKSEITLNLLNYSQDTVTLYKNTKVGTCESHYDNDSQTKGRIARISELETDSSVPPHLLDLFDRSSKNLTSSERATLVQLLNKYQNSFSKSSDDIGHTDLVQHSINTRDAAPIRLPPRRLPLGKRQIEKEEIKKMLDRGIIEPSTSAWSSPVVLITKKDGSPRFCLDYRKLNDVTVKDAYPLPRVEDCINALSGSKYFSSLDLNSGYWQVGMKTEDKEKTAFATTMGLYQFTVMSFGLSNAPSTFERLMENVLRGLQWEECLLYMDDIIVPCESIHQGIERLDHVLSRLQNANLKLKPSKCILFQDKVKFLGHVVSQDGILTDPDKITAVQTWPIPRNSKELKSFLGLCSYYRKFVKDFAKIAKPLHKISEKHAKFTWSDECEASFRTLKKALTSSPILAYPVPSAPFILDTDASDLSTGAVLSQVQNDREVVIAYHSKSLNIHEQSYCVTRKELLAVVTALKTFHSYLYGQPVLIRTDNAAVSWMNSLKRPTGQVARWLEELGTYNLTICHRPGLQHRNADALSRAPCAKCLHQQRNNDDSHKDTSVSSVKDPVNNIDVQETDDTVISDMTNLQACAVTRSQANISPFKQVENVLTNWSIEDLQREQEKDCEIQPIRLALQTSTNRPPWAQVSERCSATKTLWRMWDRLSVENGLLYRTFYGNDDTTHMQLVVPTNYAQMYIITFMTYPLQHIWGPIKCLVNASSVSIGQV